MLSGQKMNGVGADSFFLKLTTVILVVGWLLVIGAGIFTALQLLPVIARVREMIYEGYGIVHGEWVSPRNYQFIKPFIQ